MKFSSSRGRLLTKCSFTFTVTSLLADRALPDRLPCLADSNFVIPTARRVREAKSMKRYDVRPSAVHLSVCPSVHLFVGPSVPAWTHSSKLAAASLLL